MDKSRLVNLLYELNSLPGHEIQLEELFRRKYEGIATLLECSYDDIVKHISSITSIFDSSKQTFEWKYICLNFYILELLNAELSKSEIEVLSVQDGKRAKTALGSLMVHGILKKIQPNLPHRVVVEDSNKSTEEIDIIYNYNVLKCTTYGLCNIIKYSNLRMLILPHCLQGMLVAVLQIAYGPLKKPSKSDPQDKFVMTESTYEKLLNDQQLFREILDDLSRRIHPTIFVKEIMALFQSNAPIWFKKSVSNNLTRIMRSKKGVQHIALAMLDGTDDDTTKTWKILDILTKLIMTCRKFSDFQENICAQVLSLAKTTNRDLPVFERVVVSCTKCLYFEDKEMCEAVFLQRIMTPLLYFAYKEHQFRDDDEVTDDIKQTVRLIHGCFVDNSVSLPCLPSKLLKTLINVIFHFYHLTVKSKFETTNKELKELLVKYLQSCTTVEIYQLLDNFLFDFTVTDVPQFRNDVIIEVDKSIVVKHSEHSIIYATSDVIDAVFNLLNTEQKIILFGYLLKCITDKKIYFPTNSNSKELLDTEDHATNTVLERLLATHKLLSQLSEDKDVQRSLKERPDDIIEYIDKVLSAETNDFELVFVIAMILDNLISNSSASALTKYQILTKHLSTLATKTTDVELKCLCHKIVTLLNNEREYSSEKSHDEKTEFDKALEDVYDPLLPVRGHGLLVLSKLVEKKDKQAVERKQYLLNLFQLHLKDEDSFIYLNAVHGLAALADLFPDIILETLCDEFVDFSKKNDEHHQETRMKLGEVLVRVVNTLGEMALKYKAILLNTFLFGTKDEDHLIRASSLSNLGEVCRVLNYKLGTIVTEVLVCVYAIITTDKAVEVRRAAVTVIRQLFVGLQSEMLAFLKEDILPIYRTLKEIYYNDKDDVMRLQAQLALEELNENMKNFVFPNPELHFEKKIVMLD